MLWLKSFHIIAMTCWFAALFYLPRLYVYHVTSKDQVSRDRFTLMEKKLMNVIATPSMIATILSGLWLLHMIPGYIKQPWMHAKLTLVVLTVGYHHLCARYIKVLAVNPQSYSHKFFRIFNEVPIFFLVGIIILVVVKPF